MYSHKVSAAALPRYGDRWPRISRHLIRPTGARSSLPNPSSSDGSSPLFGQLQQNQVRFASIRTIFKLWQQQEVVLPVYSKKVKPDPNFDPWAPPPSAIPPRGGGGFVSDETRKRVATFGSSYSRHPDDERGGNEDLDVEAVEALIEERNDAKRDRNFERADEIRDDLKNIHGVYLNDRERAWGTSASVVGGYLGSSPRMPEQFGPTGHDYQLCDDAGPSISPLSDDEIHKLIAERLRCKLNRDFERADQIKQKLESNDVAVDDNNKLWRADGVRIYFAGGRNRKIEYTYAPDAGPSRATISDEEVVSLLAKRQDYRFSQDFDSADTIRGELEDAGVQIDDENRMWRADGKSFRGDRDDEYGGGDGYRGGGRGRGRGGGFRGGGRDGNGEDRYGDRGGGYGGDRGDYGRNSYGRGGGRGSYGGGERGGGRGSYGGGGRGSYGGDGDRGYRGSSGGGGRYNDRGGGGGRGRGRGRGRY